MYHFKFRLHFFHQICFNCFTRVTEVLVHIGSHQRDRALEVWKLEQLMFRTNVSVGPRPGDEFEQMDATHDLNSRTAQFNDSLFWIC